MVKTFTQFTVVAVLLLLSAGVVTAQSQSDAQERQSDLGVDVLSYNFVMQGLPASNQEEIEAERSFETEPDSDESYNLTEDEALEIALDELGSSEWNLEESEADDGLYEFEFLRGESQAKVVVDGSSGRIVEFEAEVEWEPENDEPSAVLSGFIQFSREGYEVDVDIDVNEENNEALFEVEIERDEAGAEVITREEIREFEDAAPGSYNGRLQVTRDDEVVHTEEQQFRVPGSVENEPEQDEESEENLNDSSLEEMSREELIDEISSLREQVSQLESQLDSQSESESDDADSQESGSEEPEQDERRSENEDSEIGRDDSGDSSNDSEDSEINEDSSETNPGSSENRPGFVDRLLSGLIG